MGALVPRELGPDEELIVYRAVRTSDPADEAIIESFQSSRALGRPARKGSREETDEIIRDGISVFREVHQVPAFLGPYVAELRITRAHVTGCADWGSVGHLTVWGEAETLVSAIVRVIDLGTCP